MIGQVAPHRRDRNVALVYRLKIRSALGAKTFAKFADPIVRLSTRIDVFADHGTCGLKSLLGHAKPFWHALRNVHVEQSALGNALGKCLFGHLPGDAGRFGKIVIAVSDQAERKSRNAENRRFQRSGDRSRIRRVVAEIGTVIDAGAANIGKLDPGPGSD